MVMNYHPKAEETPHYGGPTTAERFVDDATAYRALAAHGIPRPPQLEIDEIVKRYVQFAISKESNDEGFLTRIMFLDSSAAKLNRRGRWVVN